MTRNRSHIALAASFVATAAVLHGYEHAVLSESADWLFFLWAMAPYVACLLVLILSSTGLHVVIAAGISLVMDTYMHYAVVTSDNSTAVLGYLWMPLWNLIIFVPLTMCITLIVARRRGSENAL